MKRETFLNNFLNTKIMPLNFLQAIDAANKTKSLLDDVHPPGSAELALWKAANKPQPRPPLSARPAVTRIPAELTPRSARVARRPLSSAPAGPEEPGASFGFRGVRMPANSSSDEAVEARTELEGARVSILSHWTAAHAGESDRFASTAVYVELRLRQALAASEALGAPNLFRCAVVCDAWERVAPMLGRYESLLSLVWRELLRCMFADYDEGLPGSDARGYAKRRPFFVEVQRLHKAAAEQAATIDAWGVQREEAMDALGERSKTISHTLSVWNRALASAGAGSVVKAEALEGQVCFRRRPPPVPPPSCRRLDAPLVDRPPPSHPLSTPSPYTPTPLMFCRGADALAGRSARGGQLDDRRPHRLLVLGAAPQGRARL